MTPTEISELLDAHDKRRPVTAPLPHKDSAMKGILIPLFVGLMLTAVGAGTATLISHGSDIAVAQAQAKTAVKPERVAIVETEIATVKEDIKEIKRDGKSSNSKLDALMGRFKLSVKDEP